eukprot:GFYU01008182.1.p1 GENE.GFYU01008182.1~~GFYU01008182.1.p1  ORF type:complete len:1209 (-),score=22.60 GFYU01008182.1:432-4058(-)
MVCTSASVALTTLLFCQFLQLSQTLTSDASFRSTFFQPSAIESALGPGPDSLHAGSHNRSQRVREITVIDHMSAEAVASCSGRGQLVPRESSKGVLDCNCVRGFTGAFCQVEIVSDRCRQNLASGCQYHCHCHGECVGEGDTAACDCDEGWGGSACGSRLEYVDVSEHSAPRSAREDLRPLSLLSIGTRTATGTAPESSKLGDVIQIPAARARDLTYCIERRRTPYLLEFSNSQKRLVRPSANYRRRSTSALDDLLLRSAMASATSAWASSCGVQFRYVPTADGECSPSSDHIDFVLELSTGVEILSMAGWSWKSMRNITPGVLYAFAVMHSHTSRNSGTGRIITQMRLDAEAFFPDARKKHRRLIINDVAQVTFARTRALLIHEVGHILGFRHEHLSAPEAVVLPQWCRTGSATHLHRLSPYDPASVMAYTGCGGTQSVLAPSFGLSHNDIQGCRAVYGPASNETVMSERVVELTLICVPRKRHDDDGSIVCKIDPFQQETLWTRSRKEGGYEHLWIEGIPQWPSEREDDTAECPTRYEDAAEEGGLMCSDVTVTGLDYAKYRFCSWQSGMMCVYAVHGSGTTFSEKSRSLSLELTTSDRTKHPSTRGDMFLLRARMRHTPEHREETIGSFRANDYIQSRRLTRVPEEWGRQLKPPTHTSVYLNQLPDHRIGDWIGTWKNVTKLEVYAYSVWLSPRVCELHKLTKLGLHAFDGEVPACVGSMPSLVSLSVSAPILQRYSRGKETESCPTPRLHSDFCLGGGCALAELHLASVNMTGISNPFKRIQRLEALTLDGMHVDDVVQAMAHLSSQPHLRTLVVSHLKSVRGSRHDALFELSFPPTLDVLELRDCALSRVPSTLWDLQRLSTARFGGNAILAMPEFDDVFGLGVQLTHHSQVMFDRNPISEVPRSWRKMRGYISILATNVKEVYGLYPMNDTCLEPGPEFDIGNSLREMSLCGVAHWSGRPWVRSLDLGSHLKTDTRKSYNLTMRLSPSASHESGSNRPSLALTGHMEEVQSHPGGMLRRVSLRAGKFMFRVSVTCTGVVARASVNMHILHAPVESDELERSILNVTRSMADISCLPFVNQTIVDALTVVFNGPSFSTSQQVQRILENSRNVAFIPKSRTFRVQSRYYNDSSAEFEFQYRFAKRWRADEPLRSLRAIFRGLWREDRVLVGSGGQPVATTIDDERVSPRLKYHIEVMLTPHNNK